MRMASELDFTTAMESPCKWKLTKSFWPAHVRPYLDLVRPVEYTAALAPLPEAVYLAHGLRRDAPEGIEVDQDHLTSG